MDRDEEGVAEKRWLRLSFTLIIGGFLLGLGQIQDLKEGVPFNHYNRTLEHLHVSYIFILFGTVITCFIGFRNLFKKAAFSFLPDAYSTSHEKPKDEKVADATDIGLEQVSRFFRDGWDSIPTELKFAFFVLFDAFLGLRYQSGMFSLLIYGDPLWILQFFEFVLSSMYILFSLLNNSKGWFRTIAVLLSPLAIMFVFAFSLEQLFVGQESLASPTFNLSSTLFTGFYWAAAYLSIAVGLTLTYKVQRFGNFAQAEIMLFGAYIGFTMMWSPFFTTLIDGQKVYNTDLPKDGILTWDLLFWACVTGFILTGFLGIIIDRLVYRRFRQKNALPQAMMIASLGVAMILRGILYLRYGAVQYLFVPDIDWRLTDSRYEISHGTDSFWHPWISQTVRLRFGDREVEKSYNGMDQTACLEGGKLDNFSSNWNSESEICNVIEYLPFYEIQDSAYFIQYTKAAFIIGVFASVILLLFMLNLTRLGRQMRAVADNPDLAASSGINVERVHMTTAFLAAGISGFGGVLFGMYVRINPEVGLSILLPAFSVVVLGTLGSVRGALIASVIIGLVRSISEPVLIGTGSVLGRPSYADFGEAMPYLFLIAVLMIMPKGIGEALENWRIERTRRRKDSFSFALPKFALPQTKLSLPEIPFVKDQLRKFDKPQKGIVFAAGILQIMIVSVLDIYTSGKGTIYYTIDFIYLLLEVFGLIMLYSSIAAYLPELKEFSARIFVQVSSSSSKQKGQLFGSGFVIFFIFYVIDYLISGRGLIFLSLDVLFLVLQASGLLMVVFSSFFLRGDLTSLFSEFSKKLKALTEVQKWAMIFGCVLFTAFVYFLDSVTSGSGIIYYIIDLFYLVFIVLGVAVLLLAILKSKAEIFHRLNPQFILIAGLLLYLEDMIEPGLVRETESKMYVRELAYLFLLFGFNDAHRLIFGTLSRFMEEVAQNKSFRNLKEKILTNVKPFPLLFGIILFNYVPFDQIKMLGLFFILYSINPISDFVSDGAERLQRTFWNAIMPPSKAQYGRSSERGSWITFVFFLVILMYLAWWLPSVTNFTKAMQISRIIVLVCVFSILAFSLNLHTGITGMTNFGVIFFAGIGAVTLGLLTVPEDRPGGHGWSPIYGLFAAVLVSGIAGWLLAYPTARLRMDYFAIVTISLGEIVRISMRAEPLLRAGTGTTAIGIQLYDLPLENWYASTFDDSVGEWFNLGQAAPYTVMLAVIALISFFFIWILIKMMLSSPWGRILRAIREDEEVTMHHGHNVFQHKAMSLAVGGAIAGFGGGLWAWLNMSVLDDFINPVKSTFLIWAAFIVGGRANNKGMVIGAFIIVLTEFVFNLMVVARGDIDSQFHDSVAGIDEFFAWFVLDVVGKVNSDLSIIASFGTLTPDKLQINLVYLKLIMIGLVILVSLLLSERGLIPEVPKRPDNPDQGIGLEPENREVN